MGTSITSMQTKKSDYAVPDASERAKGSDCHLDAAVHIWRTIILGKLLYMCAYICICTHTQYCEIVFEKPSKHKEQGRKTSKYLKRISFK